MFWKRNIEIILKHEPMFQYYFNIPFPKHFYILKKLIESIFKLLSSHIMIQYILNIVKKNIESKFQIFLSISLIKMWYVKLQFLYNNISISSIFLFDPASSDMKLCNFTLLFMILQVELRLNKDH
jgi:hypothetical protein